MLSHTLTDQVLVKNFLKGDNLSFEHLLNRHKNRVFAFVMSKVKNRDLTEDIFQDTLIKVINSLQKGKYNEEGKFLPWMMRIAHNLVIDHFRKESKMRKIRPTSEFDIFDVLDDGSKNQEEVMIQTQVYSDLRLLIEQLPEDQMEVLKLRYFEEMSFKKISDLTDINIVAIPKTIDNDVGVTEYSVGFNTAVDAATKALDSLQSTAASHGRAMILEVMGRDAGHIALNAGIAGGADIILIPEIKYTIAGIINKLNEIKRNKIGHSLIIIAESVKTENGEYVTNNYNNQMRFGGIGYYIAQEIMKNSDIECRVTSLGHIQRGATPVAIDRILASAFGVSAVDLIAKNKFNRLVIWNNRKVIDVSINEGIKQYRKVTNEDILLKTAISLGTYIGNINK